MSRAFLWGLATLFNVPTALVVVSGVSDAVADRVSKSPTLLEAGCAAGFESACTSFAQDHELDIRRREQLFKAACDAGHPRACLELAAHYSGPDSPRAWFHGGLARMRLTGRERAEIETRDRVYLDSIKDEVKAVELYQEACDRGSGDGCGELARALWEGRGVAQDQGRAIAAWTRGCEELSADLSCSELAGLYRLRGDEASARAFDARWQDRPLPILFWVWVAGVAGSLALGVLVQVAIRPTGAPILGADSCKLFTAIGSGLFLVAGLFQLSTGDTAWMGWVLLAFAVLLGVGTYLLWAGRYRAARLLLPIAGFLSLPIGVFAILVSREIRHLPEPAD